MQPIRIIKEKNELKGTVYIELLPGSYQGQCWNEGSLFFDEEVFGYIEPIIEKRALGFDHYSFTEVPASSWVTIAEDLKELRDLLENAQSINQLNDHVGFIFSHSKKRFAEHFLANKAALAEVVAELSDWVLVKANEYGAITVLGL